MFILRGASTTGTNMKLSAFSFVCSAMQTIMLMGILVGNMNTFLSVNAQLFTDCIDFRDDFGVFYDYCFWNIPSPVTYIVEDGSSITFGNESQVITACISNVTRSLDTCFCSVLMNPSDPPALTDFCNSCTIQVITDTEFLPFFDCSNRLVGDCVGFDLDGFCIDNNDGVVPAPAPSVAPPTPFPPTTSTTPAPRASPTLLPPSVTTTPAPRTTPTTFPVTATNPTLRPLPTSFPTPTSFPVFESNLFYGCSNETDNGVVYESCIYNTSSPVTYELTDRTLRSFGTDSYITTRCLANAAKSISSCSCEFIVNPSNPPTSSDTCKSCEIQILNETLFWPYFDCSNRLDGDCVGFDFVGNCIPSDDGVVSSPVPPSSPRSAPVAFRPTRAPTRSTGNTPPTRTFEGTDREESSSAMTMMIYTFDVTNGTMKMILSTIVLVALMHFMI